MKEINPDHIRFLQYIENLKLIEREPLLLLSLLLVFLVILFVLVNIWKLSRRQPPERIGSRTAETHQELTLRLNDFSGKISAEVTRNSEELKQLKDRLHRLEQEFAFITRRSHEELQQELLQFTRSAAEGSRPPDASVVVTTSAERDRTAGKAEKKSEKSVEAIAEVVESDPYLAALGKTRKSIWSKLAGLLGSKSSRDEKLWFDELEELLIGADLGVETSQLLMAEVRRVQAGVQDIDPQQLREILGRLLLGVLGRDSAEAISPQKVGGLPKVVLVVGVNGVGKTTTIAKLAYQFKRQDARVLLAACDTFRAAAEEQLGVWAERVGVDLVQGPENAKPSTVAFQAVQRAKQEGHDLLIVDTAGRLHTRVNLMNELSSLVGIIQRELPGAPHETLLVVDGSSGQNALLQAREFHGRAGLTGVVVTKLDGTPKGGIVVAIRAALGVPVRYVGVGEGMGDLKLFDPKRFVDALLRPVELAQNVEHGQSGDSDMGGDQSLVSSTERPDSVRTDAVRVVRRRSREVVV